MRRRREADKNAGTALRSVLCVPFFPGEAERSGFSLSGHTEGPGIPAEFPALLFTFFEGAAYSSGAMFGSLALAWFSGLQLSGLWLSSRSW